MKKEDIIKHLEKYHIKDIVSSNNNEEYKDAEILMYDEFQTY